MKTLRLIPIAAIMMAAPLQASTAPSSVWNGDWAAWYGCWRAVDVEAAPLVCVLPGGDAASVRIATIEGGEITDETIVRADGVARPIEEGGCTGAESAFFSSDGRRVFTRAELACSGLGRTSTGVLAMVSESEWVDAQALTVNGQHAARTIRYREAARSELPLWVNAELPRDRQLAQEAARLNAATPLDIAAVAEASRHVAAPAVEALLAAHQHGFGLDAARLVQLKEEGVPTSTIDIMVALSYPQKFAVEQPARDPRPVSDYAGVNAAAAWNDDCYDPYSNASRYACYDGRYGSRYGYDRYGYSRYGRYGYSPYGYDPYGWNYGGNPVVVIVQPDGDDNAERTGGSVVKGRGYTRTGTARGTASPRTATERTRSNPAPVRSADRPSTSTSTPSTSSGSTSEPRRTAKPRGGGN